MRSDTTAIMRFLGRVRSVLSEVRHLPERLLHGVHRSAARRQLADAAPVGSALFICHGNICRSPFAAEVFARLMHESTGRHLVVTSLGFIGPGRQSPSAALAAASRRGYDMSAHRSALVTAPALHAADLVVVMSREQVTALRLSIGSTRRPVLILGDLDPRPIRRRTIHDPWGGDDRAFDESYDRIERCVAELARLLTPDASGPRSR